jgi:hypothetical protein
VEGEYFLTIIQYFDLNVFCIYAVEMPPIKCLIYFVYVSFWIILSLVMVVINHIDVTPHSEQRAKVHLNSFDDFARDA